MHPGEVQGKYAHYRFGYEKGQFSIFAGTEKEKGTSLVSLRDPVREAERHLGAFSLKPGMLAVVAGVAHMPMLEMLAEQAKTQGGWILAFEADTELYLALKKSRPDVFAEIAVIVPESLGVMPELVEKIDVENFVGYRVFENKASLGLDPSYYAGAISDFKKKLASRFSDLFTRLEFEERWVFNALTKLPLMHKARPVSALFGLGRGATALIVSTGPSLRDSLPQIKKHCDRYFIACADSAYRVLHRAGITPHLVFSLDSQMHTAKHFGLLPRGKQGAFPILVCDAVSNPCVARDWQGELALSYTAQFPEDRRVVTPGCDFIEDEGFVEGVVGLIPGDLQSGGSVATSVFDLMRLMEFDKIILIGQDLAYTRREIHTPGTHHTDEWLAKTTNRLQPVENINERVIRRRHTKRETSLTGRPIVTDYILSLYRDWFATAIARLPQKIYNATRDGLQIPGAMPHSLPPDLGEGSGLGAANSAILEKYLRVNFLQINTEKLKSLSQSVAVAVADDRQRSHLGFLRYVGRKFAIKAVRSPEQAAVLAARQMVKQRHFLRKMKAKFFYAGI